RRRRPPRPPLFPYTTLFRSRPRLPRGGDRDGRGLLRRGPARTARAHGRRGRRTRRRVPGRVVPLFRQAPRRGTPLGRRRRPPRVDRKSTRLNSSHVEISYAV